MTIFADSWDPNRVPKTPLKKPWYMPFYIKYIGVKTAIFLFLVTY